jgi:hypothetical protein
MPREPKLTLTDDEEADEFVFEESEVFDAIPDSARFDLEDHDDGYHSQGPEQIRSARIAPPANEKLN